MNGNHLPRSQTLASRLRHPAAATWQSVEVDAPPEATFAAIRSTDLQHSIVIRVLAGARALPQRAIRRLRHLPPMPKPRLGTVDGLIEAGYWVVVRETPPDELVLGLIMWDGRVERAGVTREIFDCPKPGSVRVGWGFVVEKLEDGRSLVVTETRSEPVDPRAARRFQRYWRVIAPFAQLTRRSVLRRIRIEAEASTGAHGAPSRPARVGV